MEAHMKTGRDPARKRKGNERKMIIKIREPTRVCRKI